MREHTRFEIIPFEGFSNGLMFKMTIKEIETFFNNYSIEKIKKQGINKNLLEIYVKDIKTTLFFDDSDKFYAIEFKTPIVIYRDCSLLSYSVVELETELANIGVDYHWNETETELICKNIGCFFNIGKSKVKRPQSIVVHVKGAYDEDYIDDLAAQLLKKFLPESE